jgi:hypothetical protein
MQVEHAVGMGRTSCSALVVVLGIAACSSEDDGGAFLDHEESADFEPLDFKGDGVAPTFNRHEVVEQSFFDDTDSIDAATVQAFLEMTPYGKRSFLADEVVGDRMFSTALVEVSTDFGINPVMLLSRLQVEQSLVSRSARPSTHKVDFALGCGCPDGSACNPAFRGIDKQLACAANVLRSKANESAAGTAQWRMGKSKKTLDGLTVTPTNHATAALYAYTPWVLTGQGGNWLVWNVTKKFVHHIETELEPPGDFVGSPCAADDAEACGFTDGADEGFCHEFTAEDGLVAGFCALDCAGVCPDRGSATTFCVELEMGVGACVAKSTAANGHCEAIPGTREVQMSRFVGTSGAASATAMVCAP